ncbi:glycosyltransferase family 4 protein [Halalkalibacter oceani]|uniref:glycosyltransferase family 4 protein n=1 Tax=Halalkalibacter oceani TaxID=1653776 RepID=UPI003391BC94
MKILMICTEKLPVPPVRGGAIQTYIDGVSRMLSKQYQLTILGTPDESLPDEEIVDQIRYVRIPGELLEIYQEGVVQFLQENSFDIIHIFNRPRLVAAVREHAPNARLVLSMHNDMFTPQKIQAEKALSAIQELDKIITVSDYVGKTISDSFPEAAPKLKTIYSGVDLGRFVPPTSSQAKEMRNEVRQEHGLVNKKVILFAGRLSANKGADILVQAMNELAKEHSNIALVLVGSKWFSVNEVSDYVAYVRALAAKLSIPVVNTGFVSPNEIQRWFAAADVFVCPSQWQEPLARVHYEAMASGLPIVTTARGGNPEVIIPNENGFVVEEADNPHAFIEPLSTLLENPHLAQRMGAMGRNLAEEKYTWERVANDILDVWNELEGKMQNDLPINDEETTTTMLANEDGIEPSDHTDELPPANVQLASDLKQGSNKKTKEEKLRSLLLLELTHHSSLLDTMMQTVKQRAIDNRTKDLSSLVRQIMSETESYFSQSETAKIIRDTNDSTTAKLFHTLLQNQRRKRKSG